MFLSPLSGKLPTSESDTVLNSEVPVPAPSWFRGLFGIISNVHVARNHDYKRALGNTAAREAGLRYEQKIQHALVEALPEYSPSPMITFHDSGIVRSAIPDGFFEAFDHDCIYVMEIKFSHVPDAWWQLEKKYRPLLEKWGEKKVRCIEICRTFDSAVPFPCKFEFLPDLDAFLRYVGGNCELDFGVFPWRP